MSVRLFTTLAFLSTTGYAVRASSVIIDTNITEPCHYLDTVPINLNNAQLDNKTGILKYNKVEFAKDQYGWYDYVYVNGSRVTSKPNLRGCLCAIGACFRICQVNLDSNVPIAVEVEQKIMNLPNDRLVFGPPCARMHQGNETVLKLHANGTVYDEEHEISINHEFYCLNVDKNAVVSTLLCLPEPPSCQSHQTVEMVDNDYKRLPNDSIIYKNHLFTGSQWGYDVYNDQGRHVKSLRVCYCDKVECIRLCCPLGLIGENCEQPMNGHYKIIRDIKIGDNVLKAVDLTDDEYIHRLVHGEMCDIRIPEAEDPSEVFHLHSDGKLSLTTDDNSIYNYEHHMYCLRVEQDGSVKAEYCIGEKDANPFPELLPYFMIASVPFLVVTFLVYALIPELRNMNGKCLMLYVASMLVYSITLPVINLAEYIEYCVTLGYITYFTLMLSFFWVNVMCIDIWLKFKRMASEQTIRFFYYNCYAIGGPMILVMIVAIVDSTDSGNMKPGIGDGQCFFTGKSNAEMVFLFLPIGLLISANICFFVAIYKYIRRTESAFRKNPDTRRHTFKDNEEKERFMLYVRLMTIMGLTWSMEVISWLFFKYSHKSQYFFYIFDVCNSLQGVWIFLLFVCRPKVWKLIQKWWNRRRRIHDLDCVHYSASKKTVDSSVITSTDLN